MFHADKEENINKRNDNIDDSTDAHIIYVWGNIKSTRKIKDSESMRKVRKKMEKTRKENI